MKATVQRPAVCLVCAVLIIGHQCFMTSAQTTGLAPIRVDLSPDFRRNDTGAAHWQEWQVKNGQTVTRSGTTTYRGSRTGLPGLPDTQADVGGWEDYPEVKRPAEWDTDGDGMPNHWEKQKNHDPHDPSDGTVDANGDGYTNLEAYLNWLAEAYNRKSNHEQN